MNNQPAILLLGASQDQRFIIKTAREKGLTTVVIDQNPESVGFADADYYSTISTKDIPAITEYSQSLIDQGVNLKGVTVMGSDIPDIVAKIAEHFEWPSPSSETARLATNKLFMKNCFRDEAIPIPRYAKVNSIDEIKQLWKEWQCSSIVIKPVDQAGSRGVMCIDKVTMIPDAFKNAINFTNEDYIIVEEFIPGLQISTETLVYNSKAYTPGIVDRHYSETTGFLPQIIENGGFFPCSLPDHKIAELKNVVENAARALGITSGVAKGDVVICPNRGPVIIEMAARLSGGDFSESLIPKGCDVNYVNAAIDIALGNEPDWDSLVCVTKKHVVNRYFFAPPGKLEAIRGLDRVTTIPEIVKFDIFFETGQKLPKIRSHGERTGVFIIAARDKQEVMDLTDMVYQNIEFKIDGHWYKGHPQDYINRFS